MRLFDAINSHAASSAAAGDFAAVAAAVNSLGDNVVDSSSWTFRRIGERLGLEAQTAVADFMRQLAQAAGGRFVDAHSLLLLGDGVKTGLRLDTDDVQNDLEALIAQQPSNSPSAAVIRSVKNLGRRWVPLFENSVTAEQCREAWNLGKLHARITNAAALAFERIGSADSPSTAAQKWSTAWNDSEEPTL